MKTAVLGDFYFQTDETNVKPVRSLDFSGGVQVQTHARHGDVALPEITGREPEKLNLSAVFSRILGQEPAEELRKLIAAERAGKALTFILGTEKFGDWKWIIKNHKATVLDSDAYGDPVTMEVTLNLIECPKE